MQYWNPLPILNWRKWAGHPTKLLKSPTFLPALGTQRIPFSLPVAKPIPELSWLKYENNQETGRKFRIGTCCFRLQLPIQWCGRAVRIGGTKGVKEDYM
jgi:hypothetical protein